MRSVLLAVTLLAFAAASAQAHFIPSSADLPGVYEKRFADKIMTPATTTFDAAVPAPIVQNAPGKIEQVGHEPLRNRGMNAALAVHNGYAYIGYRADGTHTNSSVMVVDVRDPAKPKIAGEIGMPNEGNIGESSRELRVLPDKGLLLVLNHGCSELIHRCASAATAAGRSPATSNIRFYDISGANAASPKLVSTYFPSRNQPQTPHEFALWTDPEKPSRVLLYETTPSSETSNREQLVVVDISEARQGKFPEIYKWTPKIGDPDADVRLHSMTLTFDGRRLYLAYLGGGFLVADTSDFAAGTKDKPEIRLVTPPANRVHWGNPGAHSAVKVPGKDYALITDEVYGKLGGVLAEHGCPWGWVRTIDTTSEDKPRLAAEYKLPVNDEKTCATTDPVRDNFSSFASHNPTLTSSLALITWHSAGFQVVDISDPARPKPAAEFLPQPLATVETEDPALSQGSDKIVMWSFPVVVDGLIYAIDLRNGLYILRYKGPHENEVSSTEFLDGNSNHGDLRRFEYRLPAGTAGAGSKGGAGSTGRTPDGRPIPPALPRRACLPAPLRAGANGVGPVGLGTKRDRVLLRTGPAERTTPTAARFCVEGGGRLLAVFSAAGRTRLVATSSRSATARIRRRGARRLAAGLYRRGKRQFFVVRHGRVTTVGVAEQALLRRPATLRRALRGL